MIVGLLQLAAFLGTAWLTGHAVDLCHGRTPGGTPPPTPSPQPRVPEVAGRR
ncbi:hypothetical protein [Klenkia sp. PcliD-1-E]|uniref:hypothetical protein n=1 Tax=Klenkia sp. PcliD-1-E TaxID=2954492 RepID=UPI0020974F35|nr:hypothetical protein [Klenkia sp. PcliD-1-E]MCO7219451.1 hypothetical protein [Klenkia sp. PcliD-1-E]